MPLIRVGIVPTINDPEAGHLYRSALILSRETHDLTQYARAKAGHLQEPARAMRIVDVGAVVVWGSDDAALAKLLLRTPGAVVLLVAERKPTKDSAVTAALARLAASGCDVHVVPFGKRAKAVAYDLGPDRRVEKATDLTRPPQQQHAPARPVATEEAPEPPGPPPAMPRAAARPVEPYTLPSVPRTKPAAPASSPAPLMPREAAAPEEPTAPDAPAPAAE